jgi:hypothetical protein
MAMVRLPRRRDLMRIEKMEDNRRAMTSASQRLRHRRIRQADAPVTEDHQHGADHGQQSQNRPNWCQRLEP